MRGLVHADMDLPKFIYDGLRAAIWEAGSLPSWRRVSDNGFWVSEPEPVLVTRAVQLSSEKEEREKLLKEMGAFLDDEEGIVAHIEWAKSLLNRPGGAPGTAWYDINLRIDWRETRDIVDEVFWRRGVKPPASPHHFAKVMDGAGWTPHLRGWRRREV